MGPAADRGEAGLREKTRQRKVKSAQVRSNGWHRFAQLCTYSSVQAAAPPSNQSTQIFFSYIFHLALFQPPSRSLTPHLAHICTGERTAVRRTHVGGRPESQVSPAVSVSVAAAAGGGGGAVDGWRSDGAGPAGLLSGEADSKQANTHARTHGKKRKKKKQDFC